MVYEYYIKHDKNCVEFSVEEPSDEFQSLMDQIELKMIWQNGFFKSIKKLLKSKKSDNQYINIDNFDEIHLENEEILQIMKTLKLTKQRVIRCFEIVVLAKLDPNDPLVH